MEGISFILGLIGFVWAICCLLGNYIELDPNK